MLRRVLTIAFVSLALPASAAAACPDEDLPPAADNVGRIEASTLCLLNQERAAHGLGPLTSNGQLADAGRVHVRNMIDLRFFDHAGRDGSTIGDRIRETGYLVPGSRWMIGENLAWGTGTLATPAEIMRAWMNSPGHRANILQGEYREVGIAVEEGVPSAQGPGGATYATEFGTVELVAPRVRPEPATERHAAVAAPPVSTASVRVVERRTAHARTCRIKRQKRSRPCRAKAAAKRRANRR